jgi:hypothetical protein
MSEEKDDGNLPAQAKQVDPGFPPELVERVKSDAFKGVRQLGDFIEKAEMPLLVIFALDNIGGTALAWTNAPLRIADDMALRSMKMLSDSETEKGNVVQH